MTAIYCANCGEILVPGAKFCSGCGKPIANKPAPDQNINSWGGFPVTYGNSNQDDFFSAPVAQQPPFQAAPQPMSKKEFRKVCQNEKYRKDLKSSAIFLYILSVVNALVAIAANPVALVDTGIYLVLILGMHLGKRKGCAVGVLLYAIFCTVVTMATTGQFGGWLWLIAAIGAIKAFGIADKEYDMIYGA